MMRSIDGLARVSPVRPQVVLRFLKAELGRLGQIMNIMILVFEEPEAFPSSGSRPVDAIHFDAVARRSDVQIPADAW